MNRKKAIKAAKKKVKEIIERAKNDGARFRVICDHTNNPASVVLAGKVNVTVEER